jgi:hypothetical protein
MKTRTLILTFRSRAATGGRRSRRGGEGRGGGGMTPLIGRVERYIHVAGDEVVDQGRGKVSLCLRLAVQVLAGFTSALAAMDRNRWGKVEQVTEQRISARRLVRSYRREGDRSAGVEISKGEDQASGSPGSPKGVWSSSNGQRRKKALSQHGRRDHRGCMLDEKRTGRQETGEKGGKAERFD